MVLFFGGAGAGRKHLALAGYAMHPWAPIVDHGVSQRQGNEVS